MFITTSFPAKGLSWLSPCTSPMFFTSFGAVAWGLVVVAPAGVTSFFPVVVAGVTTSVFTSAAETSLASADK